MISSVLVAFRPKLEADRVSQSTTPAELDRFKNETGRGSSEKRARDVSKVGGYDDREGRRQATYRDAI